MILDLPTEILKFFSFFSPLFSRPVYKNALQLFVGHVLCKGRRTVADLLRCLHLSNVKNFSKFHWVLSGAKWSCMQGSKILFGLLIKLVSDEIFINVDSTLERRRGAKIQGLCRQRDAAQSTKNNKVLSIGLNWLVSAVAIRLPFTHLSWSLPFLSILMPPKQPLRSSKNTRDLTKKTRYKKMTVWTCQVVALLRCWTDRKITIVADSAFACFKLLYACSKHKINLISRLRLDARLYDFVPEKKISQKGRKRVAGDELPKLSARVSTPLKKWKKATVHWYGGKSENVYIQTGKCLWYYIGFCPVPIQWILIKSSADATPVAIFSTELEHTPEQIIEAFVGRWSLEVTFEEARRHLGMETQRQWSDKAIERTTPIILASFSMITLIGIKMSGSKITPQQTSWYKKQHVTFSDLLAYVRIPLAKSKLKSLVTKKGEYKKKDLKDLICEAAAA